MFNALVIGAGPAGLAAGIAAQRNVCVLERRSVPGRKLLLSGSGQCNVTHGGTIANFLARYGNEKKSRFVKPALFAFDNQAVCRFFAQRGVPLAEREDGKIFPQSLNSRDILNVLLTELEKRGGILQTETQVEFVKKVNKRFVVQTNRGTIDAAKLILATGGRSYPATGSDGSGYKIAESFGHRIVPPKPALSPAYIRDYAFADCAGIAFRKIEVNLLRNEKRIATQQGDVLLTHFGLSGPAIIDSSRSIEQGDVVQLTICREKDAVQKCLTGKRTLKNALQPLHLPEQFLKRLLEQQNISAEQSASEVSRSDRQKLEQTLSHLRFTVERLGDWNESMTTAGGVALEEVNRQTLQSRLVEGLFFCGEVLDADGDSGGYNIQFALSSGFLAGSSLSSLFFPFPLSLLRRSS
ncbi:MAG: aminoacetone oxidase family FAD-binding enzyme [Planctomycetaceae bacterium]|jgi:predicted Rossmann fold flavoprotein|nr:aminoacetone oxidase family FAD-binding enzyme [Planctomycetaceae bacterium]